MSPVSGAGPSAGGSGEIHVTPRSYLSSIDRFCAGRSQFIRGSFDRWATLKVVRQYRIKKLRTVSGYPLRLRAMLRPSATERTVRGRHRADISHTDRPRNGASSREPAHHRYERARCREVLGRLRRVSRHRRTQTRRDRFNSWYSTSGCSPEVPTTIEWASLARTPPSVHDCRRGLRPNQTTFPSGGSTERDKTPTGGGDGIRTHCLYIANVALYQLSYTPEGLPTLAQGVATWLTTPRLVGAGRFPRRFLVVFLVVVRALC